MYKNQVFPGTGKAVGLKKYVVAGLCLLFSSAAFSAEGEHALKMEGRCNELAFEGKDYSRGCKGEVLHRAYPNGRVSYWSFLQGNVVSFSGTEEIALPNDYTLYIDTVAMGGGAPTKTIKVTGKCHSVFENGVLGALHLRCEALDSAKRSRFILDFTQRKAVVVK